MVTKFLRHSLIFALLTTIGTTRAPAQDHGAAHHWGYDGAEGPSHWGDLESEFALCKNGRQQSPVDIRNSEKTDLPTLQFDYKPSPLHIIDNGHTIMVNYAPGSFLGVGNKRYELKQFHFHRPSEEEVHGTRSEMVVHLVHADQEGNLAVVAVLLKKGADNPLVRELWNHLPERKGKEGIFEKVNVDLTSLISTDGGYYTFSGSLTTPPCSEGVTWFVLKHSATVTADEIEQFGKRYEHNARPIQPLNERVIRESK